MNPYLYIENMKIILNETRIDIYNGRQWLKEERYHYLGVFFIFLSIIGFTIIILKKFDN